MVRAPASFDQGLFLMHLHKGKEYFEQNQFQKAREELEAAYNLRPQDEKILNMLGMTYFKLEMLPQAEEMYIALTSNNPDVYTLQSNLGLIRLKMDKLDKAEDSLTRALELQPSNPKAHFYLGLLYEKLERLEKALFHFEQAHADKMIRKIKQKLEEVKEKEYTLLSFTIVQVLEPGSTTQVDDGTNFQTSVAPHDTDTQEPIQQEKFQMSEKEITAVAPESEWREGGSSTGKMRRRDVMEAMDRVEDREEEELVEDEVTEEAVVTEGVASEEPPPALEKTEPTFHVNVSPEEAIQETAPEPLISDTIAAQMFTPPPPPPDASFFNADDMAADISAFLAQSRSEEPVVDEDFVQEPPGFDKTEELQVVPPVDESYEEHEEERSQIPTPEEVENAIAETETHKPSIDEPQDEPPAKEPPRDKGPLEEPPAERPPFEEPVEEPPVQEPEVETQHEHPFGAQAIEESIERSFAPISKSEVQAAEPVEHTIAMDLVEHTEPLRTKELFQPANLDQFSRDRYYVQPLIGADRFLLIDPHLLEIIISDRLIVRRGTISSFTGNLSFEPWQKQMEDTLPLIQVSGAGVLFLADRRQDIYLISLNNETLYVEANHLLVVQSALKVEPHFFRQTSADPGFSMVKVSGRGTLALTCQSKPLTLNVHEAMPANIPADALIAWSGRLACDVLSDPDIHNIMMQPEGTILLRFTGAGDVVVEQGSLWGERRSKK
ncbi:MAG TPA: tetratricopeptide repeat protein [Acidobacteriota bacterium]|nr:tetratricopeptide repeat protein [Acidobacteriota bacterium]